MWFIKKEITNFYQAFVWRSKMLISNIHLTGQNFKHNFFHLNSSFIFFYAKMSLQIIMLYWDIFQLNLPLFSTMKSYTNYIIMCLSTEQMHYNKNKWRLNEIDFRLTVYIKIETKVL